MTVLYIIMIYITSYTVTVSLGWTLLTFSFLVYVNIQVFYCPLYQGHLYDYKIH